VLCEGTGDKMARKTYIFISHKDAVLLTHFLVLSVTELLRKVGLGGGEGGGTQQSMQGSDLGGNFLLCL
jgi:hypothetical protein